MHANLVRAGHEHPDLHRTAIATIVLIVCAFGYMGATGMSPHNTSRWRGGMFAQQRARFPHDL